MSNVSMAVELPSVISDKMLVASVQASVDHLSQYTGCLSELSADGIGEPYYVESGGNNQVYSCSEFPNSIIIEVCQKCSSQPHCCVDEASIDDWFEADNLRNSTLEVMLESDEYLS